MNVSIMLEDIGFIVCGIGLFFVGLNWLTNTLKQVAGRKFRLIFAKWTGTLPKAGVVGFVSGFVFQSMSALSFIMASLVGSGLIKTRNATMAIVWGNAGIGIMVLIAVLDIKTFILFLLGLAGISMVFERPRGTVQLARILFGIGLLYFGLILLNQGATPLASLDFFKELLLRGGSSHLLTFFFGALLTALCQSSTAVTILTIALAQAGLFNVQQTIIAIYGANVGSSAMTWLLSTHLKGRPRQLVMAQAFFNFVAAAFFVPLFYLEEAAGVPLIRALVESTGVPLEHQMAYVYLLFNFGGAVVVTLMFNPFHALLERLWPPAKADTWTRLKHLHDHALHNPSIAVILLTREQNDLLDHLLRYLKVLRTHGHEKVSRKLAAIRDATAIVSKEITSFSKDIVNHAQELQVQELTLNVENIQVQVEALDEILHGFAGECAAIRSPMAEGFKNSFLESLEFILLETRDLAREYSREDAEYLLQLTAERSEVFQKLRKAYLDAESEIPPAERELLLDFSSLFERAVWTLNRIVKLLKQRAGYDLGVSG